VISKYEGISGDELESVVGFFIAVRMTITCKKLRIEETKKKYSVLNN